MTFKVTQKNVKKIVAEKNILKTKKNQKKQRSKSAKKMFVCKKCKYITSRKDNLNRHRGTKRCDQNKAKLEKQKKKKMKINIKTNVKNKIGNNNKIINSNNVIINLIVFAKDGIKNISPTDLSKILGSKENIIESIVLNVNLNSNKPQNHNVLYSDLKSSYGEIYEDDGLEKK